MMSPRVYQDARAEAPLHVQLMRTSMREGPPDSSRVRVHGRIVRIFRDRDHALHWGQRISFLIPIINRNRTDASMPSGEISHDWEYLGRARFLEAFLEIWQGEVQLVLSQVVAIRRPTRRPICTPEFEGFLCRGNF